VNGSVYISVNHDSRGIFLFNSMEKSRELYRKYEAYVIGSKGNISVRFYFEDSQCSSVIVEVSKRFINI